MTGGQKEDPAGLDEPGVVEVLAVGLGAVAVEPVDLPVAQGVAELVGGDVQEGVATLHNVGPGLGVVGPTANYAGFAPWSKLLFVFLMMLGRLEMFSILVLFVPAFWRRI